MIDCVLTQECTICRACANACPKGAISFEREYKSFYYPSIDTERCVGCNKCEQVCPILHKQSEKSLANIQAYIARNKNDEIRKNSSSGGVFGEMAKKMLDMGGYVCGAIFDNEFHVKHVVTNETNCVASMCGSKYVQSNTDGVYAEIRELLLSGRSVLFSGCPCQVAGLKSFLGKEYPQLFLVELICHGIPSDELFQNYIKIHEKKTKSKVKEIKFRDKTQGWHCSSMKIEYENGKVYSEPITIDAYMKGYFGNTTLKECCYDCKFRNFRSGSDLTLGDFWGAEIEAPEIDDNKGLSVILVSTEKGKDLLRKLDLWLQPCDVEIIVKYNRNIIESNLKSEMREQFFRVVEENGYAEAIQDLLWEKKRSRIKRMCRSIIRNIYYKVRRKGKPIY